MSILSPKDEKHALIFAALGDETHLLLISRLSTGRPLSLSQLTQDVAMSRQAVTKHLQVLMLAGLVQSARAGRKHFYEFNPRPIHQTNQYLAGISAHSNDALSRLKSFVENTEKNSYPLSCCSLFKIYTRIVLERLRYSDG